MISILGFNVPNTWIQFAAASFLIIALMAGAFGGFLYVMEKRIEAYPTANGEVIKSEIVRRGMHLSSPGKSSPIYQSWVLEVHYSYRVDGKDYVSTKLSTRTLMSSAEGDKQPAEWLRARQAEFPPGKKVEVKYRPQDPNYAVLELDLASARIGIAVSLISLCLAGLFAFLAKR
jgi:uncharacterized protein YneF (UPF0154 family)